jgi:hypothetical protein
VIQAQAYLAEQEHPIAVASAVASFGFAGAASAVDPGRQGHWVLQGRLVREFLRDQRMEAVPPDHKAAAVLAEQGAAAEVAVHSNEQILKSQQLSQQHNLWSTI